MLSDLSVSHLSVHGGDIPSWPPAATAGLLGADYTTSNGRYRFAKIYRPDPWDASMVAPLDSAGVAVGEYLLAVDGRPLSASDNLFQAFLGKAGVKTKLLIGHSADGTGAREVLVTPMSNELSLRQYAWIEENRRRVDVASNGKIGYVYVPHTLDMSAVS